MQDINTSEREISNRKYGRFVSRLEHTCFTSPPSTLWKIFKIIDPARSLGAATPTTSSLKNSRTRKSLTCSRKNNTHKLTSLPRSHLYNELPQELYTMWTCKLAEVATSTTPPITNWNTWWSLLLIINKQTLTTGIPIGWI